MIVATRPVLLYVLRAHKDTWTAPNNQPKPQVPENVRTLTDACISCARHSFSLLMDSWVDGSFLTFDYFNTQYLFSVGNILAISTLLQGPSSAKDRDDFELASQLLVELKQNGNCTAVEFSQHLEAVKACMSGIALPAAQGSVHPGQANDTNTNTPASGTSGLDYQTANAPHAGSFMTAGMALAQPSMQHFLSQTDPTCQQMDISILEHELDGFYWPES
jgi:proline utilization trans-activator